MKNILFIFLSALMLNNSVDIDYIATGNNLAGTGVIDDVDSVWELLIEKFTGNSGFTSEMGNDEGIAKNKTTETFFSFYFTGNIDTHTFTGQLHRDAPDSVMRPTHAILCKGHPELHNPPPDQKA